MPFSNYSVSRTQPVPLGVQPASKSIPVVVTNDEGVTLNVRQSQPATEVALSLLGIPRAETALGVFADITTYGIDRNIWTMSPLVYDSNTNTGVRFLQNQSAASIEAANDTWAALNTNRAFPYLPGRVSSGTYGVRHSFAETIYPTDGVANPGVNPIRKWGMFNDKDGYYFEIYGRGTDNWDSTSQTENPDQGVSKFHVVRRTSGIPRDFFAVNYQQAYSNPYTNFYQETAVSTSNYPVLSAPYMIVMDSLSCFHAALHDPRLRTTRVESPCATQVSFIHGGNTKTYFVNPDNALIYEYRVPREYFGFDKLDGNNNTPVFYSDVVTVDGTTHYPGEFTGNYDNSVHSIDFSKTTMYKIEYSWYGAVGALFLAYVPVDSGDARWVRMHHLRGSNQLSTPTLGNPYLPITYFVWNSGSKVEAVEKYGASYYIDGAEKGSVKVFSAFNSTSKAIGTGCVPGSGSNITVPARFTVLSATNTSLFLDTTVAAPRIVSVGQLDQIFTPFHQNAFVEGVVYYTDVNNTRQTINIAPGKYYITDIKVGRGTNGSSSSTATLTGVAFLNSGIIPTTEWKAITADLRFFIPRGGPLLNLRMKTKFGQADVSSKATVFPARLNVGLDLPNNVQSAQVRLTKNPVYPDASSNFTRDNLNSRYETSMSIALSADGLIPSLISKIPVQLNAAPGMTNNQYLPVNTFVSGYIQGVAGVLSRDNTGAYYFQRAREGSPVFLSGGVTADLRVSNDTKGIDQFVFEPGFTINGSVYSTNATWQSTDTFSAVDFKLSEQRLFMAETGNNIVSFAASEGGTDFDLSSFFDFNREFLAGAGLSTGTVLQEELAVTGIVFDPNELIEGGSNGNAIASITWEEQ